MQPENVNPGNFIDIEVINKTIADGKFSIAIGYGDGGNEYQEKKLRFAMRWNGHTDEEKGFPTSNGRPMWFQLPDDIGDIIKTLYDNSKKIISIQDDTRKK